MTTAITLADPTALPLVLGLMERRETEGRRPDWDEAERDRRGRIASPLLEGGAEGAIWLIGPGRAPLGYAVVTFGWSIRDGREATLDDLYVRASVRRRGIGREVVHAISVTLRGVGVRRMLVRLPRGEHAAQEFCIACGFAIETGTILMSEAL